MPDPKYLIFFTTNGTIRPKRIFEATIGINTHLNLTAFYSSGITTHYAFCHVIKFYVIASFFELLPFSLTYSKAIFQSLEPVSCSCRFAVRFFCKLFKGSVSQL